MLNPLFAVHPEGLGKEMLVIGDPDIGTRLNAEEVKFGARDGKLVRLINNLKQRKKS